MRYRSDFAPDAWDWTPQSRSDSKRQLTAGTRRSQHRLWNVWFYSFGLSWFRLRCRSHRGQRFFHCKFSWQGDGSCRSAIFPSHQISTSQFFDGYFSRQWWWRQKQSQRWRRRQGIQSGMLLLLDSCQLFQMVAGCRLHSASNSCLSSHSRSHDSSSLSGCPTSRSRI